MKTIKAGDKFKRWTVLKDIGTKLLCQSIDNRTGKAIPVTKRFYLCKCKCGTVKEVSRDNLLTNKSKGCNACKKGHGANPTYKHPLSASYLSMIRRCTNSADIGYKNYGGRGIKVCKKWLGSKGFKNYIKDLGSKPSPLHSIDRINVNGDYKPSNCRWALPKIQANNKRRNNVLNISKLAKQTGYSSERIRQLLFKALAAYIIGYLNKKPIFDKAAIQYLRKRKKLYLENLKT